MKSQQGISNGTKSSTYVMLNGSKFFSLPFRLTKNTKLQWFQFRINHKILSTNSFLQKIKLKDTNTCTFCRSKTETIEHILWDCEIVQALLDDFVTFCSNKIHGHISFAKKKHLYLDPQVLEDRTPPPDINPRAYPNYFHKLSFYNIFVILH